jgi:hypothetical protein
LVFFLLVSTDFWKVETHFYFLAFVITEQEAKWNSKKKNIAMFINLSFVLDLGAHEKLKWFFFSWKRYARRFMCVEFMLLRMKYATKWWKIGFELIYRSLINQISYSSWSHPASLYDSRSHTGDLTSMLTLICKLFVFDGFAFVPLWESNLNFKSIIIRR